MTDAFEQASGSLSVLSDFAFSPLSLSSVFGGDVHISWLGSLCFSPGGLCFDHTHCFSAFCLCFVCFCYRRLVSITFFSAFFFFWRYDTTWKYAARWPSLLLFSSLLGEFLAGLADEWLRL
jgi:hypothetical protein